MSKHLGLTDRQCEFLLEAAKAVPAERRDEFIQNVTRHLTAATTDMAVQAAINAQLDALPHRYFFCDSAPDPQGVSVMPTTRYFTRDGRELTKQQALDSRGLIRNNVVMRVGNVTMMDARPPAARPLTLHGSKLINEAQSSVRIVDAHGRRHGLNMPGFRVPDDNIAHMDHIINHDARQQNLIDAARRRYEDELTSAWQGKDQRQRDVTSFGGDPSITGEGKRGPAPYAGSPAPFGSYPYSPGAEGSACTINRKIGTLRREGDWLVCVPNENTEPADDPARKTSDARTGKRRRKVESVVETEADYDPSDDFEEDDDEDGYERSEEEITANVATHTETTPRRSVRTDAMNVQQLQAKRDAVTSRIYAQLDAEIRKKWRENK